MSVRSSTSLSSWFLFSLFYFFLTPCYSPVSGVSQLCHKIIIAFPTGFYYLQSKFVVAILQFYIFHSLVFYDSTCSPCALASSSGKQIGFTSIKHDCYYCGKMIIVPIIHFSQFSHEAIINHTCINISG